MGRTRACVPSMCKSTTFVNSRFVCADVLSENWQRDKVNFLVNNAESAFT